MLWWIALGLVVAAVVLLAACVTVTMGRLRELNHTVRALRRRAADVETVRSDATALQQRAEGLQAPLLVVQARMAALQARRAGASTDGSRPIRDAPAGA